MKEIIVVEGKDDTRRLIEVFGTIDTIETNGSAISKETLELIKKANDLRGVIVFTDPDFPGQKIRQIITNYVPTVKHAFIAKEDGLSKNKDSVGIEHASRNAIVQAINNVKCGYIEKNNDTYSAITKHLLLSLHLIGQTYSKKLRERVSRYLSIGYVNGKQLEKRLKMFQITKEQLVEAVNKCMEE